MLQAPILSPCHVSPWFGLEGEVLGLGLGLEGKVLGLGLECQVLGLGLGLAGQVLVNITAFAFWLRYCSDVARRKPTKLFTMFGGYLGW